MALPSGTKLGSYEIQSPLGAGGMGEVYRATDTKLGRDIALKVLPAEMAQDPERLGRFRREAKALAQLDHPNIVTIHSVEECGGIHFLTMQLVDGLPLDRLIPQGGLPVEQIIKIASALGDALAAAHEKGIVHRDLKPANVMVSNEGRLKVLDFGLAKDVRGSNLGDATMTSASRTEVGVVMGTPAYMSPEQTSGRPLDHRTDIFSLGVLLHEMATGSRPFEGTSSAELVSSILRDTPPSVTDVRPDLPSDLARIVRRCLEKDPRHRLQTARDVSNEFRDMARTASRPTPVSTGASRMAASSDSGAARVDEGFWVAVLPFKQGGSNADLAALADGLTDDTITGLSKFSYLRVIARSSSSRYAGKSVDVRTAGKELNARYVMEGTLRQAGSKLRLAVQLVDSVSGAHLWAENYERAFSPETIFELQDDLVPRIVSTVADMNGVLPRSMSEGLRSRPPGQLSPYEAVLRSFAYTYSATPEELAAARSGLEEAVRKAPAYSDAWAMLSFLCGQDYVHGYELQANALEVATSAARRAVALGASNHLAYFSLGQGLWCQKDYDSFRDAAERAVVLNPMDGNSVAYLGELLIYAGSAERGMQLVERAKQLNPNHPGWYWFADFYHAYSRGEYRDALSFALKAKLRGNPLAPMFLAAAYGQLGDVEGGAMAAAELVKFRPELPALMRKQVAKVWNAEYGERFLEGLRKAGLEIPEAVATAGQKSSTQPTSSTLRIGAVPDSGATRADEGFWVAVLPFKYAGTSTELKALADGLSEEIVTGLSRFSYLRVIARGSTSKYSSEAGDVRAIGKELGARYVMEGSIREAGAKVRIAVQLNDANGGSSLWAETYDRAFTPEETLDVIDDVVPRIVATVGDAQGVLAHSMTEALRHRDPESLTPYEALLRSFGFHQHVSEDEHLAGITALESAVKKAPDQADCWAMLSWLYRAEYTHGYHARPESMDRSLTAARRAVNLAPSSQLAHAALASAHFFRGELDEFRAAAERALALNRMQGYTTAFLGLHFAYSGDWERGCALAERATQLNPNHPGWYWLPLVINSYRQQHGERALQHALKINMPGLWTAQVALTVVNSQLGKMDQARSALRNLLAARPDFAARAQEDLSIWWQPDMVEQMLGDLRKAGLDAAELHVVQPPSLAIATSQTASGQNRASEGFWVAVLPFKCTGNSQDLKTLTEGLSDEIITGLSRFSYLRVIARGSTTKYSSESGDIRAIGKEIGARYVMEGSLRHAGNRLRLTVQLVDTVSGAHLWAETYERAFTPESVFEVQDDLVPRIVSTIADQYGVLPRSMSEALRNKSEDALTPHEAVLRTFSYFSRITPEEHAGVKNILERAVREAPDHADSWAMLSMIYRGEFAQGFNAGLKPLDRALAAAQRAVDLAPTHALGHYSLATVYFFRKEMVPFRVEADRALALNPLDASVKAYLGLLIAASGEWDRGCQMVESAMQLNPNCPGYFYFAGCWNAYRQGKYGEVLEAVVRINMPSYFHVPAIRAAALGQLGRREEAQKALQDLLALRPDFAAVVRQEYAKWYDNEHIEPILEGLRKAGLEIRDDPKKTPSDTISIPPSIAVLPFANMSDDKEQDYFSDGLAEEIINLLAQISGLKVIARTSAFAFRGKEQDIRGIAEALGVSTVLEGSVRRAGSRIRVTAQLINAADGSHLWSERYDRELSDIFAVQDEISAAIAKALRVKLSREAAAQRYTPKLEAYEAYLKGRQQQVKVTPESLELARRYYEQAIELDPAFGMAHIGLAFYWMTSAHFGQYSVHEGVSAARAEVQRALQINPSLADGHALLGYLAALFDSDWAAAEKHFDFPMAKQASFELVKPMYGGFLYLRGNAEEAIKLAEHAVEEDPLDVWAHMNLHAYLQAAGRDDEALEQLKKVVELDPNQVVALASMVMIHADKGEIAQALKIARRAYAVGQWFPDTVGLLAALLRCNGEEEESRSIAKELGSSEALGHARARALFHLICGEIDQGADWVEKAIEKQDSSMRFYLGFVICKGLRASHRWPKIAKMVNLPA
ncbi:MAG: protein kinase [Candidatus Sulfotelmatobacter sp.]